MTAAVERPICIFMIEKLNFKYFLTKPTHCSLLNIHFSRKSLNSYEGINKEKV